MLSGFLMKSKRLEFANRRMTSEAKVAQLNRQSCAEEMNSFARNSSGQRKSFTFYGALMVPEHSS